MKKELKDCLHFHLGCEVLYKAEVWVLSNVSRPYKTNSTTIINLELRPKNKGFRDTSYISESFTDLNLIKLLLRHLSDMSDKDAIEMDMCGLWHDAVLFNKGWDFQSFLPVHFKNLLSKHFDLFGLIEAGLAIDKTTLKKAR